jgi:uncharacterized protein with von Willebrand factor type A (vWA) domain
MHGGNKWIGTGGTSPFGAHGYNPEGVRIGQEEGRQGRAVKVWERREFKNLDDTVELGTRNIKLALRKLRRFAREGAADELDLGGHHPIDRAQRRLLDIKLVPERHNATKVLLFLDVGGSMDPMCAPARNCSRQRAASSSTSSTTTFTTSSMSRCGATTARVPCERMPTEQVLRTYGADSQACVRRRCHHEPL